MQVTCATGPEELSKALYGCHLVIIPAGVPRKPGMTRDDLFNINAGAPEGHLSSQCISSLPMWKTVADPFVWHSKDHGMLL